MNKTNIKQHLRRTFSALAIIGALFTLPKAQADPPAPMHGFSTDCENLISLRHVGPNTITVLDETATFYGPTPAESAYYFTGTSVGTERDVFHADGSGTVQASHVFTGSVTLNDSVRHGTMTISLVATFAPNGTEVTRWVVDQGTGDLAGISGQGTTPSAEELGPTDVCAWDRFTLEWAGQIQFAR